MTEEQRMQRELRPVRARHDDPELPDDVSDKDLDRVARNELKTLTKDNAEWVAKHLAMAARLIDSDPEEAHKHVISAARRAGRIAVVRESLAITAYAVGDFALALRELRTYRRISGSNDQVALMVDSERGVGRPDRALELGRSIDRSTVPAAVQVALAIAMSGARLDLGQPEAALSELEIPQLDPKTAFSYSAELFAAYAEVLQELGREDEAVQWIERAARANAAFGESDEEDETMEILEIEEDEESFGDDEPSTESTTEAEEVSSSPTEKVVTTDEGSIIEEVVTTDEGSTIEEVVTSAEASTTDEASTTEEAPVDEKAAKAEAARVAKNAKARAARALKAATVESAKTGNSNSDLAAGNAEAGQKN
ncbi:MAG: primosomal protein [Cryobacterium sp.]|nr:primosomal protein [Cryobacterium sp.]